MRTMSLPALRSLLAEETSQVWTFGIELSKHPDDPNNWTTERYVANTQHVTFQGQLYSPLPLEFTLAPETEDSVPQAKLRIDNVSLEISVAVRRTKYPATIVVRLFRITPEGLVHLEMDATFTVLSARVDMQAVELTLGYRNDFLNEPAMHTRFTPAICPALFK